MTPDCPKCKDTQTEEIVTYGRREYFCPTCAYSWTVPSPATRPRA